MIIDIVAAIIVLASALISFMRGFIREVLTIAGVVGGILAAVFAGPPMAPIVREWFGVVEGQESTKLFDIIPMEIVADATTYGVIFVGVVIVLSVLSHMLSGAAKAVGLGPVDRTLGVIFGVARGLFLLGLMYLPFHVFIGDKEKEKLFEGSQTHYFIEKISDAMAEYLPDREDVEKKVDETKDDLIKKKLEEQNLLGGDDKGKTIKEGDPMEPVLKAVPLEDGKGYQEEQREKMDKLFDEGPATNE